MFGLHFRFEPFGIRSCAANRILLGAVGHGHYSLCTQRAADPFTGTERIQFRFGVTYNGDAVFVFKIVGFRRSERDTGEY